MAPRTDTRRLAMLAVGALVILAAGLVIGWLGHSHQSVNLSLGETGALDDASLTVTGWEAPPQGWIDVQVEVCPTGSGGLDAGAFDESRFVLITSGGEFQASGSALGGGDGIGASMTGCLYGSVRFATAEHPVRAAYGSVPELVWHLA